MRGRMYPGIGVSRSFGDYTAHRIGVTSEPSIKVMSFGKSNEFLVIASMSVWNVLTPKEVFDFIKLRIHQGMGVVSK